MDFPATLKDFASSSKAEPKRERRSDMIYFENEKDKRFHCTFSGCFKSFKNKAGLSYHLKSHKAEEKKTLLKDKRRAKSATTAGECEVNSSFDSGSICVETITRKKEIHEKKPKQ